MRCGLGKQEDLAAAFGRHITSLPRYVADFAGQGMPGLMPERRGPKGAWKLTPELRAKILWIVLKELFAIGSEQASRRPDGTRLNKPPFNEKFRLAGNRRAVRDDSWGVRGQGQGSRRRSSSRPQFVEACASGSNAIYCKLSTPAQKETLRSALFFRSWLPGRRVPPPAHPLRQRRQNPLF